MFSDRHRSRDYSGGQGRWAHDRQRSAGKTDPAADETFSGGDEERGREVLTDSGLWRKT